MPNPSLEGDYLGHRIEVEGFDELSGLAARIDLSRPDQNPEQDDPLSFLERLDFTVRRRSPAWPDDDAAALQKVMERGLHRARGAVLLDRVDELRGEFKFEMSPSYANRSEDYLRSVVLRAFKRVYRSNPGLGGRIDFDDIGIALMEGVNPLEVEYALSRLAGDRLIKSFASPHEPGARLYMPTAEGLTSADQAQRDEGMPAILLEESIALVELRLNRIAPELVDHLRGLVARIAASDDMTEIEVRETAQACHHVLVEFMDLDMLWEGVATAERPAKELTRERLRTILKARVPSDTEQEMLAALEQYLVGWVAKFGDFVQKYRHVAPDTNRQQARRAVLYTYLLLADLTVLLNL